MATNLVSQIDRGPRPHHRGAYCFEPGIRSVVHPESNKRSRARSSRCAYLTRFQAAGRIQARRRRGEATRRSIVEPSRRYWWIRAKGLRR